VCLVGWLLAGVGVSRISFVLRTELGFFNKSPARLELNENEHKSCVAPQEL